MATKKNTAASYTKNLAKSLGYLTFDTFLRDTPIAETISENKDTVKEIYKNIKDFAKDPKGAIKNTNIYQEYSPILKEGFTNLLDDIKTGNIYNKEREEKVFESFFDSGEDFGFGDSDFDFGDSENEALSGFDDFSEEPVVDGSSALAAKAQSIATRQNIKAMDIIGKTNAKAISETTARSAQYIVQAQQASTNLLMKQQAKIFNQVSVGLAGVNQNLGSLVSLAEPLTAHMQNSMKFYTETSEKLDKMVNLLEGINRAMMPEESSNRRSSYMGLSSFLTSSGGISLSGMKEMFGRNFGRYLDSTMLGTMFGFKLGEDGNGIFKQMAANPIGFALSMILPSLLPKEFTDSINKLGKSIAGFNSSLIKKLAGMGGNPIKDFIASMFGYDDSLNNKIDTSKYNKGKVNFDGKTRKAIIEVIPTYLSKILVALTGGFETRYDYENGRFVNRQEIKKQKDEILTTSARSITWDFADTSDIKAAISKEGKDGKKEKLTEREARKIQADIDKYFANAIETNNLIDPGKKYTDKEIKEKFGFSDPKKFKQIQELYSYYMRTNQFYRITVLDESVNRQRLAISEKFSGMGIDDVLVNEFNNSFDNSVFGNNIGIGYGGGDKNTSVRKRQQKINRNVAAAKENKNNIEYSQQQWDRTKERLKALNVDKNIISDLEKEYKDIFGKNAKNDLNTNKKRKEFIEKVDDIFDSGLYYEEPTSEDGLTGLKAVGKKVKDIISSPLSLVTNILNKADKTLFEIIYGKVDKDGNVIEDSRHESVLGMMFLQMKDMFTTFKDWVNENIFDPITNWFKDKGGFKGIINTIFGIDIDALWDTAKAKVQIIGHNVAENFRSIGEWSWGKLKSLPGEFKSNKEQPVGSGAGSRLVKAKKYYGGASSKNKVLVAEDPLNPSDEVLKQCFAEINARTNEEKIPYREIADKHGVDYGVLVERNLTDNKLGKRLRTVKLRSKKIFSDENGFAKQTENAIVGAFTTTLKSIGIDSEKADKTTKKAEEVVKTSVKELGLDPSGAITGALMGTGLSILSGGILSPMLAASIGGAAGLVIKSKKIQDALFGEEDENGERHGNLLSEEMTKFLTKKLPDIAGFSIAGGILGTVIPHIPGGPVGGLIIGSALGFAKRSETVQEFLFGNKEEGTSGIFGTEEDKEKTKEWIKRMAPKAAAGAIIGAIGGPFGIWTDIMLGTAIGFASETELFKRAIFGKEVPMLDENGKQVVDENGKPVMTRNGGLTGIIRDGVVTPLGNALTPIATELKHNAKGIIHDIGNMIAKAFSQTFHSVTRPLWDKLGTFVLGPLATMMGGLFRGAANIVTLPFRAIGAYGSHLRRKQIQRGYATYMSAKDRHQYMVQHGFEESDVAHADASMMRMGEEDLSNTLGDINSLLNISNRYSAQNNRNDAAVKVGNIVRKIGSYRLAKKAEDMADAGKSAEEIIEYIERQGTSVHASVQTEIHNAVSSVGEAGKNLEKSNKAKEEARARIKKAYNLGDDFELNDKNLLRLQEATSHEYSLRKSGAAEAVKQPVQEVIKEVAEAHGKRIERRMVDIINTLRRFNGEDQLDGGTEEVTNDVHNLRTGGNDEERSGGPWSGILFKERNAFQAMHSMWNPMHDMDEKSTTAAIQYYEIVTLGGGDPSSIQISLKDAGVSSYDRLAERVTKIDNKDYLINVTDKFGKSVNLHKIGDVWYYAAAHNIAEILKEHRAFKAIKSGVNFAKNAFKAIRSLFNPWYNIDRDWAKTILDQYDASRSGDYEDDVSDAWRRYISVDRDFPDGNVVKLTNDEGYSIRLRKKGNEWIWANPIWLNANRFAHRAGNLIKTGIRTISNVGKTIGKGIKTAYQVVRRSINPFYDFNSEEMNIVNQDIDTICNGGGKGSGEYLKATGVDYVCRVVCNDHPSFYVDLKSGKAKYMTPLKFKALKTKQNIMGIGGAIKNVFGKVGSAFKNAWTGSADAGSGSGLIPAANYYRGRGFFSSAISKVGSYFKGVGGKVASGVGSLFGNSGGEGGNQSILDSILHPTDNDAGDNVSILHRALNKINSSKFNPINFLSGSTDYNLNTKEAKEEFRKEQATLNIFRQTTFTTDQISKKMDILIGGLFGAGAISGSGSGGKKGGFLGSLLSSIGWTAAIIGGLYAVGSGKADGLLNGWNNSVDVENNDENSGKSTNFYMVDPTTGETVSIATENGQPKMGVDKDGNPVYYTTDGREIPANTENGNPAQIESTGTRGYHTKFQNRIAKAVLMGRKNPLTWARKMLGNKGIILRHFPKTTTRINQMLDSILYGAKRNWLWANITGNTAEYAAKRAKEAAEFTYERFIKIFGKADADLKWLEFQQNGMEKFIEDNAEEIGKNKRFLFGQAKDISDDAIKEVTDEKVSKKAKKQFAEKMKKEAGENVAQKAEKEAVENATEKVEKEMLENVAQTTAKEGGEEVVENTSARMAREQAERAAKGITMEEAAQKAAKEGTENAVEKAEKEIVENTVQKAVKEGGEEVIETGLKNLTSEALEAGEKQIVENAIEKGVAVGLKENIQEAIQAVFKNLIGSRFANLILQGTSKEAFETAGEKLGKEVAQKFEKEIAENAITSGSKKLIARIPVAGWICTAAFAIWEFEEGWNSAARYWKDEFPCWGEKLVCGLLPCILEVVAEATGVAVDFIPVNWLFGLLVDFANWIGWVTDDYKKRRKAFEDKLNALNEKRLADGLSTLSVEEFVTLPESMGGLGQTTWGEKITASMDAAALSNAQVTFNSEREHLAYLKKLKMGEITPNEYHNIKHSAEFGGVWIDPGDGAGGDPYSSSLSFLAYNQQWANAHAKEINEYAFAYRPEYRELYKTEYGRDWNPVDADIVDEGVPYTTTGLEITDPRYRAQGSKLLRGKGGSFISQLNPSLSGMRFGGATFGQNGCAPAVASMLTGMPINSTAGYAMNGGYANSGGTSADYFGNLFAQNGIPSEYVFTGGGSAQDYLENKIASGSPTVLLGQDYGNTSKANSPFGPGNHYVLATGEDSHGNIIVQDPEANRPNITYDRSILNSVKLGIPTGGASMVDNLEKGLTKVIRHTKAEKRKQAAAEQSNAQKVIASTRDTTFSRLEATAARTSDVSMNNESDLGFFEQRSKKAQQKAALQASTLDENHKQIWTYLISNGFSDAGAAGLMGCWEAESSNSPHRIEGDYTNAFPGFEVVTADSSALDAWTEKLFSMYAAKNMSINHPAYQGGDGHYYPGFGLAQWTGPRAYALLEWCKGKNYDWRELLPQLEYAMMEFQGKYSGVYNSLKNETDVASACEIAYHKYEGGKKEAELQKRQGYAIAIYNELSGNIYDMPTNTGTADGMYGDSSNESSSIKDSIGSIGTLFNDYFADVLGDLGEAFGIVHSSKRGKLGSDKFSSSSYNYGGAVINPDGSYSTTLKPLPAMNSSHAVNFVNAALSQKGYTETGNNITDFGKFTGSDGAPWCASFVSWAMNKAFKGNAENAAKVMYGGPTAAVSNLLSRFRDNDAMSSTPALGDIAIYKNNGSSHVGIVYDADGNTVRTVEGNTSGDGSFNSNGGVVWTKEFDYTKKSNLTGFGRPNWTAVSEDLNQRGYDDSRTTGSYGITDMDTAIDAGRERYATYKEQQNQEESGEPKTLFDYGADFLKSLFGGSGSGLVSYNVAQAGYNTINRKHKRARSVFGSGSGVVNLSKLSDSSKARYISALRQYAGSGSMDNDTMITLVKGIISLLSNVSANSDQIKEIVRYMQVQTSGTMGNMNLNVSTAANDMNIEDTDSTIREMQKLLQNLASGA